MRRVRIAVVAVVAACAGMAGIGAQTALPAAAAGGPELGIGDVRVPEGNAATQTVVVPVVLTEPSAVTVTATYTIVGDDAQTPADWTPVVATTGTVQIKAGAVASAVKVKIVGDTAPESDESLHVTLSNVNGATLAADDTGTVTILDDDSSPSVGLSVGDVVMPEGDVKSRTAKVPFVFSDPPSADVQVTFTQQGGTAARGYDDKFASPKTLLIRAGRKSGVLSVPTVGDRLREHDETVQLVASSPDVAIARGTGTVTIVDEASDAGPAVTSVAPSDDTFYIPPHVTSGPPGELIWSRQFYTSAAYNGFLVMYRSIGERGKPIFVTGRVFVPNDATPSGGRDIVAWAEGTTGLDDACAPSRVGMAVPALSNLIGAGYVVVATDFEGSGTPTPNAYLMAKSEAQTLYDSIRVVNELDVDTSGRAVIFGGSRGGHAAIAAAERAGYAPDITTLGVLGLGAGAVTDNDAQNLDVLINSQYRGFAMEISRAEQLLYGKTNPAVLSFLSYYLTPTGISQLPSADGCVNAVVQYFFGWDSSTLFNLSRGAIPPDANVLRQGLTVGAIGNTVPITLFSGSYDDIVTPGIINAWLPWACAQPGRTAHIANFWYPTGHYPAPTTDIVNWVNARFAGALAPSTQC